VTRVNGRASRTSTQSALSVSVITARAWTCSTGARAPARAYATTPITASATTMPDGRHHRTTRRRNPGWYRRVFGRSPSTRAGRPMVSPSTTDSCRGRNGKGQSSTPKTRASRTAYTVFERNSFASRSTFAITCLPSATMPGSRAKPPSSSTRFATARAAGAPDPMAMPRSACLRARASLMPSPVMATVWPLDCSASTMAFFWSGDTRPKTLSVLRTSARASCPAGSTRASTPRSRPGRCTSRATARTVPGSSPEMMSTRTPCSPK